jgi:phosphoribosylformimino-5-aminoimidazole carboxamide ribotide isomerase
VGHFITPRLGLFDAICHVFTAIPGGGFGTHDASIGYWDSPAEAALHWQRLGAEALHVVDLDGALGRGSNAEAVERILERVEVPVQVAGGLRTDQAVRAVLEAGAARAVVGTRAAKEPDWAVALCAALPGRVVVALDAREGRVAVEGWQELTETDPAELARRLAAGAPAAFLYTDVSRDGMLSRPHFEGVERLRRAVRVPVIASGGVASLEDIRRLGECGADAAIVGKALYEEKFTLPEALEVAAAFPSRLAPAPGGHAGGRQL